MPRKRPKKNEGYRSIRDGFPLTQVDTRTDTNTNQAMNTPQETRSFTEMAREASRANPGKYITVVRHGFGIKVHADARLDREAPSRRLLSFYVLNGKRRPFTDAQRIADQNAGTFRGC